MTVVKFTISICTRLNIVKESLCLTEGSPGHQQPQYTVEDQKLVHRIEGNQHPTFSYIFIYAVTVSCYVL